jgi:FkbM family methyltransferase
MEGNACYKFSTIRNFVSASKAKDVEIIVDVGANVGDVTLMMHDYFPAARIIAFEAVKKYCDIATERARNIPNLTIYCKAVTARHKFFDDLGKKRRHKRAALVILEGQPEAGPGWGGGSLVLPEDDERIVDNTNVRGFQKIDQKVTPITLAEIMKRLPEVDILKFDCEGCECSVLGTADLKLLRRIRFIVGEYHGIAAFSDVMRNKLFLTHKVNLIGDKDLGCFFAERLDGDKDGVLRFDKTGMLVPRPWLSDTPIEWHLFDERHVLPEDRYWHALP